MELINEAFGKLKNKKLLITGASGFIGSHLSEKLFVMGAKVFGTSRIEKSDVNKRIAWIKGSFDNLDKAKSILENVRPDIVYHLAGEVTASNDSKHVLPTFHSLVTSTVNILSEATRLGCERVVLTGSCTEPDHLELPCASPYAAAKSATRTDGKMFWQCYQTPVVIVRPFIGYGPGQASTKLIPHVICSFIKEETPILTSGKWMSDWVYIDDIVEGMIPCVTMPNIEGATFDLGTGILTSVKDVVLTIKEILGSPTMPKFGALPDRDKEFSRLSEIEEAFIKLNWSPTTSLPNGLLKTIDSYKKKLNLD